jgi:hypothetical protein
MENTGGWYVVTLKCFPCYWANNQATQNIHVSFAYGTAVPRKYTGPKRNGHEEIPFNLEWQML